MSAQHTPGRQVDRDSLTAGMTQADLHNCRPLAREPFSKSDLLDVVDDFEADYNGFELDAAHMAEWFRKLRAAIAKATGSTS